MEGVIYNITEVAERLHVTNRTLHYYEQKFNLQINRDTSGNRQYTEKDVELLEDIIQLKGKGLTLDGIKNLLEERGDLPKVKQANDLVTVQEQPDDNTALEAFRKSLIEEVAATVANELQQTNEKLDALSKENDALREQLQQLHKQQDDHYRRFDEKLTSWREKQEQEQEQVKKTLWQRVFNR